MKWCPHIKWRKDCKSWFIYLDNIPSGMIYYLPITDHYNYCPICGIKKPKEK